ncbi:MAG: hypothetical protein QXJ47_00005, partial [Candidatus Caldarchaeum sp.]
TTSKKYKQPHPGNTPSLKTKPKNRKKATPNHKKAKNNTFYKTRTHQNTTQTNPPHHQKRPQTLKHPHQNNRSKLREDMKAAFQRYDEEPVKPREDMTTRIQHHEPTHKRPRRKMEPNGRVGLP